MPKSRYPTSPAVLLVEAREILTPFFAANQNVDICLSIRNHTISIYNHVYVSDDIIPTPPKDRVNGHFHPRLKMTHDSIRIKGHFLHHKKQIHSVVCCHHDDDFLLAHCTMPLAMVDRDDAPDNGR